MKNLSCQIRTDAHDPNDPPGPPGLRVWFRLSGTYIRDQVQCANMAQAEQRAAELAAFVNAEPFYENDQPIPYLGWIN